MKTYAIILHMIQFFRSKQNKIKLMMKHLKTYIHKTLKVIVVNLLLLFFLFLFIESIFCFYAVTKGPCFHNFLNNTNSGKIETKELPFITIVKNMKRVAHYKYFEQDFRNYICDDGFRKPSVGAHYKGEDIILAGCSYTWGDYLEYKDTFGAVLTKFFPKYKVYNIGMTGASPKETLYILRNYEKYQNKKILPTLTKENDVKYFIYTAIPDQKIRIFVNHRFFVPTPLFKIQKSKSGEKQLKYYESNNPIYKTFAYSVCANKYMPPKIFDKYIKNLFTLYMQEIKKEVETIYPNAKFVLFIYDNYVFQSNEFDTQAIKNLGIDVIKLNEISTIDFSNEKYQTFESHPNGKAWQEIVPLLGKELDL